MGSAGLANSLLPRWGSRSWRICTGIFSALILVWGAWTTVSDYLEGYVFWWYNLSFALFGISGLGLVLLVREGILAYNNAKAFGLHPKRGESAKAIAPEDGNFETLSIRDTDADTESSHLQENDDSRG